MIEFWYFPQVIEAHRRDLHALAQPPAVAIVAASWRRAIGIRLVQLGCWIARRRPDTRGEASTTLGTSTEAA